MPAVEEAEDEAGLTPPSSDGVWDVWSFQLLLLLLYCVRDH